MHLPLAVPMVQLRVSVDAWYKATWLPNLMCRATRPLISSLKGGILSIWFPAMPGVASCTMHDRHAPSRGVRRGLTPRASPGCAGWPHTANSRVHRLLTFDIRGLFFDSMGIFAHGAMSMIRVHSRCRDKSSTCLLSTRPSSTR